MATLYIAEYKTIPNIDGHLAQLAPEPAVTTQTVSVSGTSARSAAFNAQTNFIGITCDGIFSYTVGGTPTATTSHFRIPADQILFLVVQPGDKIAAITNT